MSTSRDSLELRLREHRQRQDRLRREFARLSVEATRLVQGDAPVPWWHRLHQQGEPSAASGGRASGPQVTVVVPVYNAFAELQACLEALARHTTYPATLLLIDDASPDPRITELLEMASGLTSAQILRNVENIGFTATVNRALRSSVGDVVLLNSDTAVGPRWLEQLVRSAYAAPDIGTVTPVSDNAGAFSVPVVGQGNELPAALGVPDAARLLGAEGWPALAETPTGSGFCLYVKRALIEDVGGFDAEAFPTGYGEENDFCMRALRRNWRHVVDGRTFVHHEREASFGERKAALSTAARAKLDELHPDYTSRVRAFIADESMEAIRTRAAEVLTRPRPRPRLLFVIHEGGGGAIATNRDLMRSLEAEFDSWVFSSDRWTLRLARIAGGEAQEVSQWPLERPILLGDFSREDYRDAFRDVLERSRPELVHIRHVFKHTLDAPRMAAEALVPVVMSIHDHYTLCPTIHLLDDTGRYCGGICTPGHGNCQTLSKAGRLPPLKHAFVYQWREEMEAALRGVDAFVTTSPHTREVHQRTLAVMRTRRFELIEHGRDLEQASGLGEAPVPGGAVRILIPGNLDRHKGAELIATLRELDAEERLDLHFLGEVPERWRHLGTMHGGYDREHFHERVGELRPAFIGILSVVAETYNHALTEAWAAGVPVLATDLGAQGERVRAHGGGFLVPVDDPAAALRKIFAAADDPRGYAQEVARANLLGIPAVADMTVRYADLYRDVLDRRRSIAVPAQVPGEPLAHGIWRAVALLAPASISAGSRLIPMLRHPDVRWKLRTRVTSAEQLPDLEDVDLVIVQADAIPDDLVAPLLGELERRGGPLLVDLGGTSPDGEAARALCGAAAVVTVAHPQLATELESSIRRIRVVRDGLDEELLSALVEEGRRTVLRDEVPGRDRPLRLVRPSVASAAEAVFVEQLRDRLLATVAGGIELITPRETESQAQFIDRLGRHPAADIALIPRLEDDREAWRSDHPRLVCAALGIPVVISAADPSAGHQLPDTALLVAPTVEAWREAILQLAGDAAARSRLAEAARAELVGERLLRHSSPGLLAAAGEALSLHLPAATKGGEG